jgi:phosphoribosylformimino-5-aminoimidazole carboxamide ribotide isomerase
MIIFPAIDIKDGKTVRLTQGDYSRVSVYALDPAETARNFKEKGAKHLHVVDLDGAKDGALSNFNTIKAIISATDLFVEVGGGIRDEEKIRRYLSIGVSRVILGTAAVQDSAFLCGMVEKYGEKIAVGVDAKNGFVAVNGWQTVTELRGVDFCGAMRDAGVKTVIYTDIEKDGAMQGTNREIYRELKTVTGLKIVASGGISSLADVKALAETGTHAAIVGKAFYTNALRFEDVLQAAGGLL